MKVRIVRRSFALPLVFRYPLRRRRTVSDPTGHGKSSHLSFLNWYQNLIFKVWPEEASNICWLFARLFLLFFLGINFISLEPAFGCGYKKFNFYSKQFTVHILSNLVLQAFWRVFLFSWWMGKLIREEKRRKVDFASPFSAFLFFFRRWRRRRKGMRVNKGYKRWDEKK